MPKIKRGGRAGKLEAGKLCEAITIHLHLQRHRLHGGAGKMFNRTMGAAARACRRHRYEEMVHYLLTAGWVGIDREIAEGKAARKHLGIRG